MDRGAWRATVYGVPGGHNWATKRSHTHSIYIFSFFIVLAVYKFSVLKKRQSKKYIPFLISLENKSEVPLISCILPVVKGNISCWLPAERDVSQFLDLLQYSQLPSGNTIKMIYLLSFGTCMGKFNFKSKVMPQLKGYFLFRCCNFFVY